MPTRRLAGALQQVYPNVAWQRFQAHFSHNVSAAASKRLCASLCCKLTEGVPQGTGVSGAGFKDAIGSHDPPAGVGAPGPRRLNAEVKRAQKLIAIFPSEGLLIKLVGTYLIEENDRWVAKSKQYLPAGGRRAMRGRRRHSQR